jgi:hypothetical protein
MNLSFRIITLLLFVLFFALTSHAQKKNKGANFHENQNLFGSKKKEKGNQSRALSKRGGLFKRKFSAGNADAFASHKVTGGRGLFSRLFNSGGQNSKNASLRKTRPGKIQNREQSKLFGKYHTNNKKRNNAFLHKQNKRRKMSRVRGNSVFAKRKR